MEADSQGSGAVLTRLGVKTCSRCGGPIVAIGAGCHETAPNSGQACCHTKIPSE